MAGKSRISRAENLNTGYSKMQPKFIMKFGPKSPRKFPDYTNRYKDMEDLRPIRKRLNCIICMAVFLAKFYIVLENLHIGCPA